MNARPEREPDLVERREIGNEEILAQLDSMRRSNARSKTVAFLAVAVLAGFLSGPLLRRASDFFGSRGAPASEAEVATLLADAVTIDVGSPAAIEIFQITDMECPFCAKVEPTVVAALKEEFVESGRARLRVVQMPIERIHPRARMAARLMLCANRQNPALVGAAMAVVYRSQARWTSLDPADARRDLLKELAAIGLHSTALATCEATSEVDASISQNQEIARQIKVPGTPAFYLAGRLLPPDSAAIVKAVRDATLRAR